jgi:hypothetical protein
MFLGSRARPVRTANNLAAIFLPIVYTLWEPRRLRTLWASTACYCLDVHTWSSSFAVCLCVLRSRDNVVAPETGCGLDDRGVGVRTGGGKIFLIFTSSISQWILEALSFGVKQRSPHLVLAPKSRICGSMHRLRHTPSWRSA